MPQSQSVLNCEVERRPAELRAGLWILDVGNPNNPTRRWFDADTAKHATRYSARESLELLLPRRRVVQRHRGDPSLARDLLRRWGCLLVHELLDVHVLRGRDLCLGRRLVAGDGGRACCRRGLRRSSDLRWRFPERSEGGVSEKSSKREEGSMRTLAWASRARRRTHHRRSGRTTCGRRRARRCRQSRARSCPPGRRCFDDRVRILRGRLEREMTDLRNCCSFVGRMSDMAWGGNSQRQASARPKAGSPPEGRLPGKETRARPSCFWQPGREREREAKSATAPSYANGLPLTLARASTRSS